MRGLGEAWGSDQRAPVLAAPPASFPLGALAVIHVAGGRRAVRSRAVQSSSPVSWVAGPERSQGRQALWVEGPGQGQPPGTPAARGPQALSLVLPLVHVITRKAQRPKAWPKGGPGAPPGEGRTPETHSPGPRTHPEAPDLDAQEQ